MQSNSATQGAAFPPIVPPSMVAVRGAVSPSHIAPGRNVLSPRLGCVGEICSSQLNWPAGHQLRRPGLPGPDIRDFLEKCSWFRVLPSDLRAMTLESAVEMTVAAGESVAKAGATSTHWYGLMQGLLHMRVMGAAGTQTTLGCLREGEWGGEGSLLKREKRRYDLRALTPARVCLIPFETFEVLRQTSISFNQHLCELMNVRMGSFVGMLEASRLHGPDMRVAYALLSLAGGGSEDDESAARLLPIPQCELALICGLSRQRVNVAISLFKRLGLVRSELYKGFLSVHLPRLRAYAAETNSAAGHFSATSSRTRGIPHV